ncbi:MAG: SDR family oxidoreductase [Elusimicrobia bacterium]|nr:SDR family oxidoreductase [Elusimicrobiota bacterium]
MKLAGKTVLVTGAAKRVGRALVLAAAQKGARLAVHYRGSKAAARELVWRLRAMGREAEAFQAELSDAAACRRLIEKAARRFGGLHVLINNASLYEKNAFGRTSLKDWDSHLDVNLRAPFFLSQAAAAVMLGQKEGKIINIADWAGVRPYADYIPYCVSKAGLLCLNTALAKALAPHVQVNAILPGPVLLPENSGEAFRKAVVEATPLRRLGSPEDVARAALFLIEEDFITGASLPVDGGRLIA